MSQSRLRRAASMPPQALLNSDESSGSTLRLLLARGVRRASVSEAKATGATATATQRPAWVLLAIVRPCGVGVRSRPEAAPLPHEASRAIRDRSRSNSAKSVERERDGLRLVSHNLDQSGVLLRDVSQHLSPGAIVGIGVGRARRRIHRECPITFGNPARDSPLIFWVLPQKSTRSP